MSGYLVDPSTDPTPGHMSYLYEAPVRKLNPFKSGPCFTGLSKQNVNIRFDFITLTSFDFISGNASQQQSADCIHNITLKVFFNKFPGNNMPKNLNAEKDNPCLKEQEISYKCLHKNNFDREKCELQFANYNNCKEFWNRVRSERRAKGITPFLPNVEDRAGIKEEYMKTKPSL